MKDKTQEKQLADLERAIIMAYSYLLNNEIEQAKKMLEDQIEKTYDKT
jgi:Tfp pilus assembly protein PilF